jgi:murein DD-endopeptidase MepM/ murein hydrolase activator NlpD
MSSTSTQRRTIELRRTEDEWLEGPDVREIQEKLGFTGPDLDGVYGPRTAAAVETWKRRFGYLVRDIDGRLEPQDVAWLLGEESQPPAYRRRVAARKDTPPTRGGGRAGRRRMLKLTEPHLEGPDVRAVQAKLGFGGTDLDGVYGPRTAAAVRLWKWRFGFPERHVNDRLGAQGQALLLGERQRPHDYAAERPPYPPDWRRGIFPPVAGTTRYAHSEFGMRDKEGAPDRRGDRYHGGKDWYAKGGTTVRAPVAGKVWEATPSRGDTGQIYGGTVKIVDRASGQVWVFRHVSPRVRVGQTVEAGDPVATVVHWKTAPGSSHVHIELWKSPAGGYRIENMIDPWPLLEQAAQLGE